jgi:hypothetical protein
MIFLLKLIRSTQNTEVIVLPPSFDLLERKFILDLLSLN